MIAGGPRTFWLWVHSFITARVCETSTYTRRIYKKSGMVLQQYTGTSAVIGIHRILLLQRGRTTAAVARGGSGEITDGFI